jgi:WD40 repeat protein
MWAAIGEESGAIRVYQVPERRLHATLQGHTGPVSALRFSPDAQRIYSVSLDKSIRVWQLDGTSLSITQAPAPIHSLTLFDAGKQLASGGEDLIVQLWTINAADNSLAPVRALSGHTQNVTSLATVNDGQILSGSLDGTIRLWQTSDGQELRQMNHGGPVVSVAVRPDGTRFASASSDTQSAKVWNAADGSKSRSCAAIIVQVSERPSSCEPPRSPIATSSWPMLI